MVGGNIKNGGNKPETNTPRPATTPGGIVPKRSEMRAELERVTAERDRLLEALEAILMLDPSKDDAAVLAVTVAGDALQEAGDEGA
ncbi:MAG: hypothetical protein WC982_14180 [Advenella sp.]